MEIIYMLIAILFIAIIYDKYIQKKHQLLINYPVIGRLRYVFEALREPFRQYFADEDFHGSRDRTEWVYKASHNHYAFSSFAPKQSLPLPKFMLKHTNEVLNDEEIVDNFSITYGQNQKMPFHAKSIISRSAMSDGALSPEATQAYTIGSNNGNFPINTGEGGITSNFFITHKDYNEKYMETINIPAFHIFCFKFFKTLFRMSVAKRIVRYMLLPKGTADTYLFDEEKLSFYRPNWDAPLEDFPEQVPSDMPDIIYQMSSGLYGSRDKDGNFDPIRYQKNMKFCHMTEIKIAQGAKQTGGKLIASKVTEAIAYYRGVEPHKDLFAPNRFPYANSVEELFDFIAHLQELSSKPVGIKIVISDEENIEPYAHEIRKRLQSGDEKGIPDFISLDGGEGGSATAPISLMERVGLHIKEAIYIVDNVLRDYGIRDKVKIIASGKILTPDDIVIALALGADSVAIGRGFMMSGGCIRARECSGANGRHCPVGMATQDKSTRASYLVKKNSLQITHYHDALVNGIRVILSVMGLNDVSKLRRKHLKLIDTNGNVYNNISRVLEKQLHPSHKVQP